MLNLEDASLLNNLHEAPLLHLLHRRFKQGQIYTNTANLLISINPYRVIPGLYDLPRQKMSNEDDDEDSDSEGEEDQEWEGGSAVPLNWKRHPHIFSVAEKAYDVMSQGKNQSVLITGESGSGKTEACKQVMHHLASLNQKLTGRDFGDRIESCLIQSNLVLEAFGNAKTCRNDNSSRFGKYVRLLYRRKLPTSPPSEKEEAGPAAVAAALFLSEDPDLPPPAPAGPPPLAPPTALGTGGAPPQCTSVMELDTPPPTTPLKEVDTRETSILVGARTDTFVLEKSRLTVLEPGERNYHIFYQLCEGFENEEPGGVPVGKAADYSMLCSRSEGFVDNQDDAGDFVKVAEALTVLGLSETEKTQLFQLLATLLHMGNIQVHEKEDGKVQLSTREGSASLEEVAGFLGLEECFFTQALKERTTASGRGTLFRIGLSASQAEDGLHALIKHIYTQIFNWLVHKINLKIGSFDHLKESENYIGILDIYGFEIMQKNSLEQLLINYANEILQFQFNQQIFIHEQFLYEEEGVSSNMIHFADNRPVIDLLCMKPTGLLALLEEQALLARKSGTDQKLLNLYHQTHLGKHDCYSKPRFESPEFIVRHFAGEVTYNIEGFLAKNNDTLHEDLLDLVSSTTHPLLLEVLNCQNIQLQMGSLTHGKENRSPVPRTPAFHSPMADTGRSTPFSSPVSANPISPRAAAADFHSPLRQLADRKGTRGGSKKKPRQIANQLSVSYLFRTQLKDLVSQLQDTDPHYVKCLRPNNIKAPSSFNHHLILEQLRYSGVLELIRIRREAFPIRIKYADFMKRFQALSSQNRDSDFGEGSPDQMRWLCKRILEKNLAPSWYEMGRTKVFMRDTGIDTLKNVMFETIVSNTLHLQRMARGFLARRAWQKLQNGATQAQALVRGYTTRRRYLQMLGKLNTVQSFVKSLVAYEQYKRTKRACIKLQAYTRRYLATRRVGHLRHEWSAALKVQTNVRAYISRKRYLEMKALDWARVKYPAAKHIQAFITCSFRNQWLQFKVEKLFLFASTGDAEGLNNILSENPQLMFHRQKAEAFRTLMHAAVQSKSLPLVSLLSPLPEDVLAVDTNGNTVLHEACKAGSKEMVSYLLRLAEQAMDSNADPNSMSQNTKSSMDRDRSIEKSLLMLESLNLNCSRRAGHKGGKRPNRPSGLMSGWLKKRRETDRWHKRWCLLTQDQLMYYRNQRDTQPSKIIELKDSLVRRSQTISCCFEVHSPQLLLHKKNREGRLYFQAADEPTLQQWLTPACLLCGARNFKLGLTRVCNPKYINRRRRTNILALQNNAGNTPLHQVLEVDESQLNTPGLLAIVKLVGWLVENGSDINAQNAQGDTLLHLAFQKGMLSLASSLIIKGASLKILNNSGQSPMEAATMDLERGSFHGLTQSLAYFQSESPLSPPPPQLYGYTYFSFMFHKLLLQSSDFCPSPMITITLYDVKQKVLEQPQNIACAYGHGRDHFLFYSTWHMQTPLQNLPEGCFVLIELKNRSTTGAPSSSSAPPPPVVAWTVYRIHLDTVNTQDENLQMYLPPRDIRLRQFKPADLYLHGETILSQMT